MTKRPPVLHAILVAVLWFVALPGWAQTIDNLVPYSAPTGSPATTVTLNGIFSDSMAPMVFFNVGDSFTQLTVSTFTTSQIVATIPASLLTTPETALINLQQGSNYSNSLVFQVTSSAVTLSGMTPNAETAEDPGFTLTINGGGFQNTSVVTWNGSNLTTTFVSASQLTASVPASLIGATGTADVGVTTPGIATQPPTMTFTISPIMTVGSLSPHAAAAGGGAFTITLNGSGFNVPTELTWNNVALNTTFVNPEKITALVPANLIATAGTALVGVEESGQETPQPLPFTIYTPLTSTSLSPNNIQAGLPTFTMSVFGGGFTSGTLVTWNGAALATTFMSASQLNATVPASLIATAGTASVGVSQTDETSPAPLTFTINPPFAVTSIMPTSAIAGGPSFTLTVNGSAYDSGTFITWNGMALSTSFVSTQQLTASIPASFIATAGMAMVTVSESGQTSPPALIFTINPALALNNISPNNAVAGSPGFTLTANGGGFTGSTVVTWNGAALATTFVSAAQLTATVPASLIATAGMASITVSQSGQTSPTALIFTINPALALNNISPNNAVAGSPGFTLTANGGGFTGSTVVTWNGAALATTFVSAAQLTATVPASLIATAGMASVTVSQSGQTSPTALIFTINPALALNNISPNNAVAGSPGFTLTANGGGFTGSTVVTWNGAALATTFVSAAQLTATVPASLIATAGMAMVTVSQSGQTSPTALIFTINPALALNNISPNNAVAGSPGFTLTANGGGFTGSTVVTWNGAALATTFMSAAQLTATVPASLIATAGMASVTVSQSGQTSPTALIFTINPALALNNISPNNAVAGSPGFTLTANGGGFTGSTVVTWNGAALATTFVSAAQLTATVPASLIATAGMAMVTVSQSGQTSPTALIFTINPALALNNISPNNAVAGSPGFTLTANGGGFTGSTVVTWNGAALATTFMSAAQLTATVPASLIATAGMASVTVSQSGQTSPTALIFTINPALALNNISPNNAVAGSPGFTLTANGGGFTGSTVVTWNGAALATTFVSAAQLTATVPASLIATAGMASVTVSQSGQTSPTALIFTINPALALTNISPNNAVAGSPGFTLTANGGGFTGSTVVTWNGAALATTFVSAAQLTATVPASLITTAGMTSVTVSQSGQTSPSALIFTINPALALNNISPNNAVAGSPGFTLTANGGGFTGSTVVTWNGAALATTFMSAAQLTATVPASLIATAGMASVTVSQSGQTSPSALIFTINPALALNNISPNNAVAGSPGFTLTANGGGFTGSTVVTWNGAALAPTFMSAAQLTATVPASLIATAGMASVTVSQSGQTSPAALTFTINPALALTNISPNNMVAGSAGFALTANGGGFTSSTVVTWNGAALTTVFVSAGQLMATVPANLIATAGTASVTVSQSGQTSPAALTFTINPALALTNISPNNMVAGSAGFTLTANGGGFTSSTVITWNGAALMTAFVSATQLTATVPANLIATAGTASVTVSQSGQTSPAALTFTINPALALTNISPNNMVAGSPGFTLTANGGGFTGSTVVTWNGAALATTFVSATQLTATVLANLIATAGTASVTVSQSGQTSPAPLTFTISSALTLNNISPNNMVAGSPGFTLTANGGGFTASTVITWNGAALTTAFVSATQLTGTVPANLIAAAGIASITVLQTGQTSPAPLTFTISSALTLNNISPNNAVAGSPGFTLTANGGGFTASTVITWNGAALTTAFVSATQLTATVPANLIAAAATASVTVSQLGQTSPAPLTFTINAALTLTTLLPASVAAGGSAFTLTVNGTGIAAGTTAYWNTTALATTVVNASQLTAMVPANLSAQPGSASITAQNGNQVSNALAFTVSQPPLTLTSLAPSGTAPGGPSFVLTISGSGFPTGAIVTWNGTPLSTSFVSATQLTANVPASLIVSAGSASVGVTASNQTSPPPLPFQIGSAGLTITVVTPGTAVAGSASFNLLIDGTGFGTGTTAFWNNTALQTSITSTTQMTATVPANLIAPPGPQTITAKLGSQVSNAVTFNVTPGALTLTSITPNGALTGGPAFTVTANGSGFTANTLVTWHGTSLNTTFLSATQLTAQVPAGLIATTGTVQVGVEAPNQASPPALPFVINQSLILTSLSPASVPAGGPMFTLVINGLGLGSGDTVFWNSTPLAVISASPTQLSATVPAILIAQSGSAAITVQSAGVVSNALTFSITSQALTLTDLSPASIPPGSPDLSLTVDGTGFVTSTTVTWNGQPLTTQFVSASQLIAIVPAALLVSAGSASVSVTGQPQPEFLPFTIYTPLTLTSISPATIVAGGAAFTLTAYGSGFTGAASITWNGTPLVTTYVSPTQMNAAVPSSLIAVPGQIAIDVGAPGEMSPAALPFSITAVVSLGPILTSLSPSSTAAGGPGFTLNLAGSGFLPTSSAMWNSTSLKTSYVSATQLMANVTADLIAQAGNISVVIANGNANSNVVTFTITSAAPMITTISPASVNAGSPAINLVVNGIGFVQGATVSLNSTALITTFASPTQVTAAVPAGLLAQPGTVQITLANPTGSISNSVALTIAPVTPTITGISPPTIAPGSPGFTLTVTGSNFLAGVVVLLNNTPLNTTLVSPTQLTAQVPSTLVAQPGAYQITVINPGGTQTVFSGQLTVATPSLSLTSLSPTSARVGDPGFTLSLTGAGFVSASTVEWSGSPLPTTFVSSTQLTATVAASLLNVPGNTSVTVVNPGNAGAQVSSNTLSFTVQPVIPTVSYIAPNSAMAGDPGFTMAVSGAGFVSQTTIQWNTTALTTHYVSANQVTADVPAALLVQAGSATVMALNPGNSASNPITFTITPAPLAITGISKTSATAGDPAFVLAVAGAGFSPGATVTFGSSTLATTFVTSTQLTATVPASLLLLPGTLQVVVQQAGVASTALSFVVNLPAPPALSLTPPLTSGPVQQPVIGFGLNAPYPIALSGVVTMTFAPNATIPIDDPSIQFVSGGRTLAFTVAAGVTTLPVLQIQTGTVAGVITISVKLTAAGIDVTPTGASGSITIPKAAPVILPGGVTLIRTAGGIEVDVVGYSTPRDISQATFHLNVAPGLTLASTDITVPLTSLFTTWYQSTGSISWGSQFTYAQQFTLAGDSTQIQSVSVTLTNSVGTSVSMTSK